MQTADTLLGDVLGAGSSPHRDCSPAGHDPLALNEKSSADSAAVAGTLDRRASQTRAVEVRVIVRDADAVAGDVDG